MRQFGRINNLLRNIALDVALLVVFLLSSGIAIFTGRSLDNTFNTYDYLAAMLAFLFIAHLLLYFLNALYCFFARHFAKGFVFLGLSLGGILVFWTFFALYLIFRGSLPIDQHQPLMVGH